ncbi:hypothetical protein SCHPADRAFT_193059 [Schizopora paradoxa]|uniref:Uncharacterized protein n=1 Tax=Schizopora paradoxa TaxID=27342 RepID=A0A0H2SIT5_9AGAM|nr:hypothetical protein SCHPADRAFT_193059 [Schizopora paradoxa]
MSPLRYLLGTCTRYMIHDRKGSIRGPNPRGEKGVSEKRNSGTFPFRCRFDGVVVALCIHVCPSLLLRMLIHQHRSSSFIFVRAAFPPARSFSLPESVLGAILALPVA